MGREWHWSRWIARREKESAGCMSGMIHFFDFHQLLFTTSGSRTVPPPGVCTSAGTGHIVPSLHELKGVEAPRNSLELEVATVASSLASGGEDYYYDVPVGIQVAPAKGTARNKKELEVWLEEERRASSQAGTPRTPNLVARLMGLDILPDSSSTPRTPNIEYSEEYLRKMVDKKNTKKKKKKKESLPPRQPLQNINTNILAQARSETGSRSLPDTPRASSARSWDVGPRLSLQLNKENNYHHYNHNHSSSRTIQELNSLCEVPGDHHTLPPSPSPNTAKWRKKEPPRPSQEENKSPRSHYYARQIVKQVKESISRRGGGSEEQVVRSRRTRPADKRCQSKPSEELPPSSSPPWPADDRDQKPTAPPKPARPPVPSPPMLPSSGSLKRRESVEAKAIKMASASKCKKATHDRFTERIKRPPPPPEAATRPLPSSSASPSNLSSQHQKSQPSLDSFGTVNNQEASHQEPLLPCTERIIRPSSTTHTRRQRQALRTQKLELKYVRSILERGGIMGATATVKWFSPSLPIDPIVFHQLELELPHLREPDDDGESSESKLAALGPLGHRWNRKLLFHLVEEILGDLLLGGPTPSKSKSKIDGESLLRRLWSQIGKLPGADCRVMGDIDALVEQDLPAEKVRRLVRHPSVVAEAEDIALEIERDVMDSLVGEAAASLLSPAVRSLREYDVI